MCQNLIETVDHLFADCPFFISIWTAIFNLLGMLQTHDIFEGLYMEWTCQNFQILAWPITLMLISSSVQYMFQSLLWKLAIGTLKNLA